MPSKKQQDPKNKGELTAAEAAELAEAEAKAAAAKAAEAKAAAEAEAAKEYEAAAKAAKIAAALGVSFTNKRNQERIFRREIGEPEFFLHKKDLVPPRHVLTEDEEEEISRKVEIPTDHTPRYQPIHLLSPEFGGTSDYEYGLTTLLEDTKHKLERLKNDPNATKEELMRTEEDLKYLDSLYQNYYFGMNVFRTAKGGRDKLRE